ncbi:MAG: LapA family protein [Oxalobacter sp.]|nr:MAG: LapA family protein [Oxalobacter sp.]
MKLVTRVFAIFLFLLFFGFALKNAHEVTLRLFFGNEWRMPLALLLLAFFLMGAFLGVLAVTPTIIRKRRELTKRRKELEALQEDRDALQARLTHGPQPDVVIGN